MTRDLTRMESRLCRAERAAGRRRVRGFTLLELLLVLALVVTIGGVAGVALQRPLMRQMLKKATDDVRNQWCEARVDAMKSGQTYAFRYLVHGNRFHLGRQDDSASKETPPASPAASAPALPAVFSNKEADEDPLPPAKDGSLPAGISFMPCSGESEPGEAAEPAAAEPSDGWSDPILFYADGTTSDAGVMLSTDKHSAMRLRLRGITGSVTVEDGAASNQ